MEQFWAFIGIAGTVLFSFAKIVGVIKAFLFTEKAVAPLVKKRLVNDKASFVRAHMREYHNQPLAFCQDGQCSAL